MKTWSKLLIAVPVLLTQGFAQEPKRLSINQAPADAARQQTVATGSAQRTAPMVQPKALPPLSPSLGDIARAARAAHAAAPKAQVVVENAASPEVNAATPEKQK
jgi:hypothetical protein